MKVTKKQLYQAFKIGYVFDYNSELSKNVRCNLSNPYDIDLELAKEMLISKVTEVIQNQPKPIGVLHSSGVDSNFMLQMARKCYEDKDIRLISIGYEGDHFQDESELSSKITTSLFGNLKNWRYQKLSSGYINWVVSQFTKENYQNLFFSSSIIPTYFAVKAAVDSEVNTIITGDAGDELFCGYDRYLLHGIARQYPDIFSIIKTLFVWKLNKRQRQKLEEYCQNDRSYESLVTILDLGGEDFSLFPILEYLLNIGYTDNIYNEMMHFDIVTELFGVEKHKVDTAVAMNGNPNLISPFFDPEVMRFCCKLPLKYKLKGFTRKYILREILSDTFPKYKEIVGKKKVGFALPISEWIKNISLISSEFACVEDDFLDMDFVKILAKEHMANKKDNGEKLFAILVYLALKQKGILEVE